MKKENNLTIPNFLSGYRIIAFPFIIYLVLNGYEKLFSLFLIINLITDILDGFIARRFNMQTALGAKLDSIADMGTYILAFLGIFIFKYEFLVQNILWFSAFAALYLASWLTTILKFGKICGLHLYTFKVTGYLQGIFFGLLFLNCAPLWFFYLCMCVGCLANIEEIIIFILLKKPQSNVKGLFWVMKKKAIG